MLKDTYICFTKYFCGCLYKLDIISNLEISFANNLLQATNIKMQGEKEN